MTLWQKPGFQGFEPLHSIFKAELVFISQVLLRFYGLIGIPVGIYRIHF